MSQPSLVPHLRRALLRWLFLGAGLALAFAKLDVLLSRNTRPGLATLAGFAVGTVAIPLAFVELGFARRRATLTRDVGAWLVSLAVAYAWFVLAWTQLRYALVTFETGSHEAALAVGRHLLTDTIWEGAIAFGYLAAPFGYLVVVRLGRRSVARQVLFVVVGAAMLTLVATLAALAHGDGGFIPVLVAAVAIWAWLPWAFDRADRLEKWLFRGARRACPCDDLREVAPRDTTIVFLPLALERTTDAQLVARLEPLEGIRCELVRADGIALALAPGARIALADLEARIAPAVLDASRRIHTEDAGHRELEARPPELLGPSP